MDSIFQDRAERMWASTHRGMASFEDGRFMPRPSSPRRSPMVGDTSRCLWISTPPSLFHVRQGTVADEIPWLKLGRKDRAWAVLPDPAQAGLWLGFLQGVVAYFKDYQIRASYGRAAKVNRASGSHERR